MSGKGKGAKGLGKGGAKRHRKRLRDNIQGITKPAIRRLARRGGVKRMSGMVYEETRGVLKAFLESVIRDAVAYTEHAKRKTVTAMDVVFALKRQGKLLYGFGDVGGASSGKRVKPKPKTKVKKSQKPVPAAEASVAASSSEGIQYVPDNFTNYDPRELHSKKKLPAEVNIEGDIVTRENLWDLLIHPEGWLNDAIISLYMKMLNIRNINSVKHSPKSVKKCFFFNTYFITGLFDNERMAQEAKNEKQINEVKRTLVRKCSKHQRRSILCPRKDLDYYDMTFVPLHVHNNHWTLAVIVKYEKNDGKTAWRIEHYDSFNEPISHYNKRFETMLRLFVWREGLHKVMNGKAKLKDVRLENGMVKLPKDEKGNSISTHIPIVQKPSVEQKDTYNCGVYMCTNAKLISEGLDIMSIKSEHIGYFRKRIAMEILAKPPVAESYLFPNLKCVAPTSAASSSGMSSGTITKHKKKKKGNVNINGNNACWINSGVYAFAGHPKLLAMFPCGHDPKGKPKDRFGIRKMASEITPVRWNDKVYARIFKFMKRRYRNDQTVDLPTSLGDFGNAHATIIALMDQIDDNVRVESDYAVFGSGDRGRVEFTVGFKASAQSPEGKGFVLAKSIIDCPPEIAEHNERKYELLSIVFGSTCTDEKEYNLVEHFETFVRNTDDESTYHKFDARRNGRQKSQYTFKGTKSIKKRLSCKSGKVRMCIGIYYAPP